MGHTIQVQFNHIWNEFAASKLWEMIFFVKSNVLGSVGVCAWLWVLENCKGCTGRGGANLRGLIMTPYYSMQELPSFAHHITCMAWHGKRRCMSYLTQLGTYWLQGETSTWISCCSTCLFLGGRKERVKISFSSSSSKIERNNAVLLSYSAEYSKQSQCTSCLLLMWKNGMNSETYAWLNEFLCKIKAHLCFCERKKIIVLPCTKHQLWDSR